MRRNKPMSNSSLVCYTNISPNRTSPRNHVIDTITIHHMAGNASVETCGDLFASASRQASANYGIGSDGRIGMYVEEADRSWCSSNKANDHRAVTIEVANDGGQSTGWHISDAALDSLIKLCADICKRNNIKQLLWKDDASLIGQVDKQNITIHRWFAATACPGEYLHDHIGYVASEVNKILSPASEVTPDPQPKQYYRVRTSWEDAASQKGAFADLNNAKACADSNPGYNVFDWEGNQVYPQLESALTFPECPFIVNVTVSNLEYREKPSADSRVRGVTGVGRFTIVEVKDGWGRLKSGAGWIWLGDTNCCTVAGTVCASTSATPATPKPAVTGKKSNEEIAAEVWKGLWGKGSERKRRLIQAGYNYEEVQATIKKLYY